MPRLLDGAGHGILDDVPAFDLKLADMVMKAGIRRLEKGSREEPDEHDE